MAFRLVRKSSRPPTFHTAIGHGTAWGNYTDLAGTSNPEQTTTAIGHGTAWSIVANILLVLVHYITVQYSIVFFCDLGTV